MGQSLGEFFISLGVDSTSGSVTIKELISSFGELEASTLGEIGALSSFGVALADLSEHGMAVAEGFRNFTNQTGLSIQGLEKWQIAGKQVGVQADTVANSIKTLQSNLNEIALGRGNISPYFLLGITPGGKSPFQILEEVRSKIKSLPPAIAVNRMKELGVDPTMINLLRLTRQEQEKLASVAHGMTDQQAQSYLQMSQELAQINAQMQEMGTSAGLWLKPLLDDVSFLTNLFHNNHQALVEVAGALAIVGIAASAAFFPWLLTATAISAALAGIILIMDDIITYFRTGKSAGSEFGNTVEKALKSLEHSSMNWLWEKGLISSQGPTLGAQAPAIAGGHSNVFNIVVHDNSGRPHETVADEFKRAIDHADKMRP